MTTNPAANPDPNSAVASAGPRWPQLPFAINRAEHHHWLVAVTQLPTAAGKEQRVIRFIRDWVAQRPQLILETDPAGNLVVRFAARAATAAPIFITAHLDHPAFVVERLLSPTTLELSFRGGVMDDYFVDARVVVYDSADRRFPATLTGVIPAEPGGTRPFTHYRAELRGPGSPSLAVGDVAVWDLPPAEVVDHCLHTAACDDLAAVAAALSAFDVLLTLDGAPRPAGEPSPVADVRLLFTRAEEIGFIGAIAACKHATMPAGSLVIALENSRSFPHDSPIHGGPIVRVGDRMSVFSPALTDALAARAELIAGGPAAPTASQKNAALPAWKWQRKLMAGGACEASVFCSFGYTATCLCLPLGNYHNMADLAAVQAGTNATPPRVGREFIGLDDFDGLVDLLIGAGVLRDGQPLGPQSGVPAMVERLWTQRSFVLA